MVCWAAPNVDSDLVSERRTKAIENIKELKGNKALFASLEALEKSLKSSSGTLPCVDGAVYKVPILKITPANGDQISESGNKGTSEAPAAKRAKTAVVASKEISPAGNKGKDPTAASSAAVVWVKTYPPSEAVLTKLKQTAVSSPAGTEVASPTKGSASKRRGIGGDVIYANRVSINNAEWQDKGLKTPMTKILKTLVGDSIDPKSVSSNLVRIQLVGAQGLDWHRETPTDDHIGTLLVVLPLKCKGGKITVRHGDDTWSIDPAKSKSTTRCSWIAFASEAEVSVEAVTDGPMQALLVYHIVGKEKKGKKESANAEKVIIDMVDRVAERAKPESRINRLGVFLINKYNPKDFSAASLKGQDRWLYNLFNTSKYDVKLTFVRVLMTAWGFFDSRDWFEPEKRVQMAECGDEFMDSEIWEMDMSKKERWPPKKPKAQEAQAQEAQVLEAQAQEAQAQEAQAQPTTEPTTTQSKDDNVSDGPRRSGRARTVQAAHAEGNDDDGDFSDTNDDELSDADDDDGGELSDPEESHHKCRRLPWEMPWLHHKNLIGAIPQMTRVDREAHPSWSEGLWLSETYRVAALLITLKPEFEDESDGPYTHFYPVAHPDPRGVSEREDMKWSQPVWIRIRPGEDEDKIDQRIWNRRNWVHQDLD